MKKRSICLSILICLFLFSFTPAAEENCSKDVICLNTAERDRTIFFTATNLKTFEVTLTIEFPELINMQCDTVLPYTETLAGNATVELFSLRPENPKRAYRWRYRYYWTYGSLYASHDPETVYILPYPQGKKYQVIQGFGGQFSHSGDQYYAIDWDMPEGAEVCAARAGIVVGVQDMYTQGGVDNKFLDYANFVMIKHADGTIGEYDHFTYKGVKARVGERVKAGDIIGYAGNVGYSSGPHLHFFVYRSLSGKERESLPIRFRTEAGLIVLEQGLSYVNPVETLAQEEMTATVAKTVTTDNATVEEKDPTRATIGKIEVILDYTWQGEPAVCFQVTDVTVHGRQEQQVHFGFNVWQGKWLQWVGLDAQPLPYAASYWQEAGSFYYPYALLEEKGNIKKAFSGCFYIVDTYTNRTIARKCVKFKIPEK